MDQCANITVGFADPGDVEAIVAVLAEAAGWMRFRGGSPWSNEEINAKFVASRVNNSEFVVARSPSVMMGVCTLSKIDPLFWPEDRPRTAAYLHKLAVPRLFAGGRVTPRLVDYCRNIACAWSLFLR